jgi:hypothetical protein
MFKYSCALELKMKIVRARESKIGKFCSVLYEMGMSTHMHEGLISVLLNDSFCENNE